MMQLWRWIRGRSAAAWAIGLVALTAVSGCRTAGTQSNHSYEPIQQIQPVPAAAPYDDPRPLLAPPQQNQTQIKVDLENPDRAPAALIPDSPVTESSKVAGTAPVEPVVPAPVEPSAPSATSTSKSVSKDVFADDPLPAAPMPQPIPPVANTGAKPRPVLIQDEPAKPIKPVDPEPVVKTPVVEEPIVEKPVIEKPAVDKPVVAQPSVDEPALPEVKQPAAPVKSIDLPIPLIGDEVEVPVPKVELPKSKPVNLEPAKTAAKIDDDLVLPEFATEPVKPSKVVPPSLPTIEDLEVAKPTQSKLVDPMTSKSNSISEDPVPVPVPKAVQSKPMEKSVDPVGSLDPFEAESGLPAAPLPATPLPQKPMAVEKTSDVAVQSPDKELPQINAGPITKAVRKPDVKASPVESTNSSQVAGRPTNKPAASSGSDAAAPGALNDPMSSLPLRAPVRITDFAEFDQPADHLIALDDGSVLVSHRTGISRVRADGRVEAFARPGSPRGIVAMGEFFAVCDGSHRAVVKLGSAGNVIEKLATKSDGYFLRAPKDLVRDSQGGLYFTDPGYARIKNPIGQVHYVGVNGKVNVVAQKLGYPDGLALSPDQSRLYVVEGQEDQVLSFEILSEGKVGPKKVLAKLPVSGSKSEGSATGIAVDQRGRVYVAQQHESRIQVIDPDGRILTNYQCANLLLTDIAIVPGDRNQLLVAGNSGSENGRGKLLLLDLSGR